MSRSQGEELSEWRMYWEKTISNIILTITDRRESQLSEQRILNFSLPPKLSARMLKLKIFETCEDNRGAGDNINNVSE